MNYETLDYLFSADYRNLNFVKAAAAYYEVTKEGKIIYHENRDWNTVPTKISINN